jgi:hypothetical protein
MFRLELPIRLNACIAFHVCKVLLGASLIDFPALRHASTFASEFPFSGVLLEIILRCSPKQAEIPFKIEKRIKPHDPAKIRELIE